MRILWIVITVVVIVSVGAGVYLYSRRVQKETGTTANSTVVSGNSNTTSVSTTPTSKGDIVVDKSVSYRDVTFGIDTALLTDSYRRKKAAEGTRYLVLFLKPFSETPSVDPLEWASREIRIASSGASTSAPIEVSIPNRADVSGGYLWFEVPKNARDFSLKFGTTTLALGF